MTMQLELWHLILLLISFFGFAFGAGKVLLSQFEKRIGERLDALDRHSTRRDDNLVRLEREIMELKIKLPENYVRREDYVRGQTVIEAKLDSLYNKLENLVLRGGTP